jgi:hypothetical protein
MLLRRYSAVNHLAQAASSVLENDGFVYQMIQDWNRLDMDLIRETGEWIAQCDEEIVLIIEKDVRYILQRGNKLEHWTTWIDNLVSKFVDGVRPFSFFPPFFWFVCTVAWFFFSTTAIANNNWLTFFRISQATITLRYVRERELSCCSGPTSATSQSETLHCAPPAASVRAKEVPSLS